jgi:hypothetical protein
MIWRSRGAGPMRSGAGGGASAGAARSMRPWRTGAAVRARIWCRCEPARGRLGVPQFCGYHLPSAAGEQAAGLPQGTSPFPGGVAFAKPLSGPWPPWR